MTVRENVTHHVKRAHKVIAERRLFFALIFVIGGALMLTIISVTIYNVGGFYRYDLSRPGFEKERQEISKTPTDVTYDTTSALTQQAVGTFVTELDAHRKNLNDYDSFGNGGLSDQELQLTEQTAAPQ